MKKERRLKTFNKNISILKKTGKIIGDFILFSSFLIFIFIIFSAIQSKSTGEAVKMGDLQFYSVEGGSMKPNIEFGSIIIVKQCDIKSLQPNDIITYFHPTDKDTIVTHRIISVNKGKTLSFITKGDANDNKDIEPIPSDNILGKVLFTIPYLGYLLEFFKTKTGILLFIIIPFSLLLFYQLFKFVWILIIRRKFRYLTLLDKLNKIDSKLLKKG